MASDSSVIDSNSSRGIVSEGTTLTAVADGEGIGNNSFFCLFEV